MASKLLFIFRIYLRKTQKYLIKSTTVITVRRIVDQEEEVMVLIHSQKRKNRQMSHVIIQTLLLRINARVSYFNSKIRMISSLKRRICYLILSVLIKEQLIISKFKRPISMSKRVQMFKKTMLNKTRCLWTRDFKIKDPKDNTTNEVPKQLTHQTIPVTKSLSGT